MDLVHKLTKQLSSALSKSLEEFLKHDRVICYYDNGQRELAQIIITAFNTALTNVEIRKVTPADYKLFQAADLLCTMELLSIKAKSKALSRSENLFFKSERYLNKQYLRALQLKRL